MDLLYPSLREQTSPAPWLTRQRQVDVPQLIRQIVERNPQATVQEVSEQLRQWNVQIPGSIVAMWVCRLKGEKNRAAQAGEQGQGNSRVE